MWTCPVCAKENNSLLCTQCGFDGSCDFEQYPSLSQPAEAFDSVSRRKKVILETEKNILHCPSCGKTQFSVDFERQQYLCVSCNHRFSINPNNDQREETRAPQNASGIVRPSTDDDPTGLSVAEEVKQQATACQSPKNPSKQSRHTGFERTVLWLGWAVLLIHLLLIGDNLTSTLSLSPVLLILMGITVFMQYHLWKRGFDVIFQRKTPAFLEQMAYRIMTCLSLLSGIIGATLIIMGYSEPTSPTALQAVLLGVAVWIIGLYYGLWNLGQLSAS